MKKVILLADREFGENLCELLNMAGFESENIWYWGEWGTDMLEQKPDLLIAEERYLRNYHRHPLVNNLKQYPYILLCEDGLPQNDLPDARQYIQIPCSDLEIIDAVQNCLCSQ